MFDRLKDRGRRIRDDVRGALHRAKSADPITAPIDNPMPRATESSMLQVPLLAGHLAQSTPHVAGHSLSAASAVPSLSHHEPIVLSPPNPEPTQTSFHPGQIDTEPPVTADHDNELLSSASLLGEAAPNRPKQGVGHTAWAGVKTLLAALNASSDAFGPLKSAVEGLEKCILIFENEAEAREDYRRLKGDLDTLCSDIAGYMKSDAPPAMTPIIDAIARGIAEETTIVQEKQERNKLANIAKAEEDEDAIIKSYKRIHELLARLSMNANMNIWRIVDKLATDAQLNRLSPSSAAMYNSKESGGLLRNGCTPSTRVEVLNTLLAWAKDPHSEPVYWLNGMAGTGKTTIAYSLCQKLEEIGQLAASFFCSAQLPECRDVTCILPSIAYQLALFSRPIRFALSAALERHPEAGKLEVYRQLDCLISSPLRDVKDSIPSGLVIVIDALDECEDSNGVSRMLSALLAQASDLPIKLCLTSRPEPELVASMRSSAGERLKQEIRLHELECAVVQVDIKLYLENELKSYPLVGWKLDMLVERSGVLFIYAATIARYVGQRKTARGIRRLDQVLAGSVISATTDRRTDELYEGILQSALYGDRIEPADREDTLKSLHIAVCAMEPLTVSAIAGLTNTPVDLVRESLESLSSVIHVSDSTDLVTTLHQSFPDYLLDQTRSGRFYCDSTLQHSTYTRACLDLIGAIDSPFNICKLQSSYLLDREVQGLEETIRSAISDHLYYACRYWLAHLTLVVDPSGFVTDVNEFLSARLLVWMEVMNLKKQKHAAAGVLHRLEVWLLSRQAPAEVHRLAHDAWRFATEFANSGASQSTPHLYVSLLPFWPENREVAKLYSARAKGLVKASGSAMTSRARAPVVTCTASSIVLCLAYSPHGDRLVSGLYNGTICIWDAYTGEMIGQPITDHEGTVWTVAWSPTGSRIASGSYDHTIRFWDAASGKSIGQPLTAHTDEVYSVAYSLDGALLASGSVDRSICVWEAHTGELRRQIHTDYEGTINCVCFSPDSTCIASGSYDAAVRIWNTDTGEKYGEALTGHSDSVRSVMYSADGARLVSCSDDMTILVWDVHGRRYVGDALTGHTEAILCAARSCTGPFLATGSIDDTIRVWSLDSHQAVGPPLTGHTETVWAISMSPDGVYLASGSGDSTICIWDMSSVSAPDQPTHGHTSLVLSVASSPDGSYIASGSADKTICIWDARTGNLHAQPLTGHTGWVNSVAYSPDGKRIASGSDDCTARTWDAQTGEMHGEPLKGHTGQVLSVAYSPNGAYLASGSGDSTIIIWDLHSGQIRGQPMRGHTDKVTVVAYSPDGAYLASGSDDETIRIWNARTGEMHEKPLTGHIEQVMAVAYSPDSASIVSGSADCTVRVWDARSGSMRAQPLTGHTSGVRSVTYSRDGAFIISGSRDSTVRIWDVVTGASCGTYEGHNHIVSSVACSSDGTYIVSGSGDQSVRMWEMPQVKSGSGSHSDIVQQNWRLDGETGWVVRDDGALLVWLPPGLRDGLMSPGTISVMSRKGCLMLDFADTMLGEDWTMCYNV